MVILIVLAVLVTTIAILYLNSEAREEAMTNHLLSHDYDPECQSCRYYHGK